MTQTEIWKKIKGYEDCYEVSSHGRVRSLDRSVKTFGGTRFLKKGRVLKPGLVHGYECVVLSVDTAKKTRRVARLVAAAFIPNPQNLPQVNHKDGNKRNNHVDNLEWCTPAHNTRHAHDTGLVVRPDGEDNPAAKLSNRQADEIILRYRTEEITQRKLAEEYGVSPSLVSRLVNGHRRSSTTNISKTQVK